MTILFVVCFFVFATVWAALCLLCDDDFKDSFGQYFATLLATFIVSAAFSLVVFGLLSLVIEYGNRSIT